MALWATSLVLLVHPALAGDPTSAGVAFSFKLKLEPGQRALYRQTSETDALSDDEPTRSTRVTQELEEEVRSVSGEDALLTVKLMRLAYLVNGDQQGANLDFDSRRPPTDEEPSPLLFVRSIIDKSFPVTLAPSGQVLDVRAPGPNRFNPRRAPDARPNELFGVQRLRQLLEHRYAWMPDHPVRVGDQWTREETMDLGAFSVTRRNRAKYVGKQNDRRQIDIDIDILPRKGAGIATGKEMVLGEILPSPPGSAHVVFREDLGLVEQIDASVAMSIRFDAVPDKKLAFKKSVTRRMVARTRVELLNVGGPPAP